MFDNLKKDFAIYGKKISHRGFWALICARFGQWGIGLKWAINRKIALGLYRYFKLFVEMATGAEISLNAKVGRRFLIKEPNGIVITDQAVIGDDVTIHSAVVIGPKSSDDPAAPLLGNRIEIGSGAKLLGAITIGDDVTIGANAVVIKDVPPKSIAVGVPAKISPKNS